MGNQHIPVYGYVDEPFNEVRKAFAANFAERSELGASLAVYFHDRLVVHLWGGYQDLKELQEWNENTLVNFYSIGKPLVTLCLLREIDLGHLQLDERVSRYWPQYATAGKEETTIRQILCHQSGQPAIQQLLETSDIYDWELICQRLAEQPPWYPPGERLVYQTNTYGFLVGELVRRSSGLPISEYFSKYVANSCDADIHFGLSKTQQERCADIDFVFSPMNVDLTASDQQLTLDQKMSMWSYFNPPNFGV